MKKLIFAICVLTLMISIADTGFGKMEAIDMSDNSPHLEAMRKAQFESFEKNPWGIDDTMRERARKEREQLEKLGRKIPEDPLYIREQEQIRNNMLLMAGSLVASTAVAVITAGLFHIIYNYA
jgi:hypothetical protein